MTCSERLTQSATWREIHAQPQIWRDWSTACDFEVHRAWIKEQNPQEIWFCGAGTSAYIGDIIAAGLEDQREGPRLRSVASTDLVSRPEAYLQGRNPLVINFGRSGNSSETLGTLEAMRSLCPDAPMLNITCNGQSALADESVGKKSCTILLPPNTHDQGFAMTSSFSTMLMTALTLTQDAPASPAPWVRAADLCDALLPQIPQKVGKMPERAVFLGTGALSYAAREAALKVMELTAGQVACLWDSVLGFRHGPKSFVNADTQIVVFTGSDTDHRCYEADLIAELALQFPMSPLSVIGTGGDIEIDQPDGPIWSAPLVVLYGQIAGAMWSAELGLDVDDPFKDQGTLSRVVSGVRLYEVPL